MSARINKFIAQSTGLSRRAADLAVSEGKATINGRKAVAGDIVTSDDTVLLDNKRLNLPSALTTLIMNKPIGYVCSRNGQGSRTVYELLPSTYHRLKTVGRLDKDSSGLLILTDDGQLANQLTHPRYAKTKIYDAELNKPLEPLHHQMINDYGIKLEDGLSRLSLTKSDTSGRKWNVTIAEGRNRQIRRTFEALGYRVTKLHRTNFGNYTLGTLKSGSFKKVS